MGPEAIKRETTHGQQSVEEYIILYNFMVDKLVGMDNEQKLEYFNSLKVRAGELIDTLLTGTTSDPRFAELQPLSETKSPGRRWSKRSISIADYGELQISGSYEKDEVGNEYLTHGSVEHIPDLIMIRVPNTPSIFIVTYIEYTYSNVAENVLSGDPEKYLSIINSFVHLYDEVDTLDNLCVAAGLTSV
jgi:hypothetical protein